MLFFFSSRRRHTRFDCDWSSDVCSSDLDVGLVGEVAEVNPDAVLDIVNAGRIPVRSEEHTSELQSQSNLVCRLLLEKKKTVYTRLERSHRIDCVNDHVHHTSVRKRSEYA